MIKSRWLIVLLAIPICLAVVLPIYAERAHLASAGGVDPSCISSSPCIEYDNNSTGQGMKGVSLQGNGVTGWTEYKSTSSSNSKYGVVGNDQSISGAFDGGVLGKSVRGTGVSGVSTNGIGLLGMAGTGVTAAGSSGTGVEGDSTTGAAILAHTSVGYLFYGLGPTGQVFYVDQAGDSVLDGFLFVHDGVGVQAPDRG